MSRLGDSIGVRPSGLEPDDSEETSSRDALFATSDRSVRIGLAVLAAILGLGLLAYVVRYGRNLFYWDDYELVLGLTGQQPTNVGWFFAWQNEHLVAMVRFVFYVVWHTTGDTRVMMFLVCAGLVLSTALLLETARMVRGRAVWTDAVIPLLLLNWGHYQSLIFPLQFFFAWAVALACGCLWAFVRARETWRLPELCVVLIALPLLPLNGIFGVLFAAPFVLLAIRTALERALARDGYSRRDATLLGISAVTTAGTIVLNLSGYHHIDHHPPADSIAEVIAGISEVLAVGLGPAGIPTWPASGIAVGALATIALGALLLIPRSSNARRRVAEAMAAILVGFGALVCAIGYGRAGLGPTAGFASRYSVFSAVLVCSALIVLSMEWQRRSARSFAVVILLTAIAVQPQAVLVGREYGHTMATVSDKILSDLADGVPIEVVAHKEGTELYPNGDGLTTFFRALSASGGGAVGSRTRGQRPCGNEVKIAPRIEHTNTMNWNGQSAECSGEDPFTVFALDAPVKVCAVRVRFRLSEPVENAAPAMLQAFWAQTSRNEFDPGVRNQTIRIDADGPTERTVTFWIGDTIDRFRIDPNTRPCRFELIDFTLITQ